MGDLYFPWADIAADAGLVVKVTDTNAGWERRARSSGGFAANPLGTMWHHAASSNSTSDEACVNYQVRGNPDNPVGNCTLGRTGDVWPIAGGASNCSGKGGPWSFSRGTCPLDSGNTYLANFEVNNDGVGGRWSSQLIDAYFALSEGVNTYLGNRPDDVVGHHHYTPSRKVDPAVAGSVEGLWVPRSINSSGTWNLDDIRAECIRRASALPPEVPDMTDDQARQLDALYQTMCSAQPGFPDPGGGAGNLNAGWAALWGESLIANNVLTALADIQARLARIESS